MQRTRLNWRRMLLTPFAFVARLLPFACSACAVSYVDAGGTVHTVGLVAEEVRRAPPGTPLAGEIVSISTVGLALGRDPSGGYAALGYSRWTTAALRDDVAVFGNPVAALQGETAK